MLTHCYKYPKLWIDVVYMVASILIIGAIIFENRFLMFPWLVLHGMSIVTAIISLFVLSLFNIVTLFVITFLVGPAILILCYFWRVVYYTFVQMREEENMRLISHSSTAARGGQQPQVFIPLTTSGQPPVHVQATTVNMETNFFMDNHQRTRPETPPPPYELVGNLDNR